MSNIVPSALENFFSQFRKITYKKGETILRAGDPPAGIYLLEKGYVRLYSLSAEGKELTLLIYQAGDVFPAALVLAGGGPSLYYSEALTPVELKRADKKQFIDFAYQNTAVFRIVSQQVNDRFRFALRRMEYLAFGDAYAKVASMILICAEKFGQKEGNKVVIQLPLTHQDIASLAGVTRETTSLELSKLEKKGLISFQKHLPAVNNLADLAKESLSEY
ncbi:Crp/Fnr family transcriptional regulator [Candidatus Microgenomates bacterium]|nr:Crp/Fnr family transcriptional regulator [Candidatus Microgenomates bacterium]